MGAYFHQILTSKSNIYFFILFQLVMYIFRLGVISSLLSEPFVNGFTTAAAIHVLTSQIGDLLGLKLPKYRGYFKCIRVSKIFNYNKSSIKLNIFILLFLFNLSHKLTLNSFCFYFQTVISAFDNIKNTNFAALITSGISIVIMILNNEFLKVGLTFNYRKSLISWKLFCFYFILAQVEQSMQVSNSYRNNCNRCGHFYFQVL